MAKRAPTGAWNLLWVMSPDPYTNAHRVWKGALCVWHCAKPSVFALFPLQNYPFLSPLDR